jgi:putative salt-induced outer membrane protein YdiY
MGMMKENIMKTLLVAGLAGLMAGVVVAQEAKPAATAPVAPWNTSLAAGVNVSRGNTRTMLLNGKVMSEFRKDSNEASLGVEGNYGEAEVTAADGTTETQGNVENARGYADYRRLLNAHTYGYLNSEIRNDNIAGIDYRFIVGPGIGQYLIRGDAQNLSVEAGVAYISEKVAGIEDDKMALRLAQKYDRKIGSSAKVWESAECLPTIDDFDDYLFTAEVGVEAAMNARVSLRLVLQDKYDSTPGAGLKRNDLVVIGGLTVKL